MFRSGSILTTPESTWGSKNYNKTPRTKSSYSTLPLNVELLISRQAYIQLGYSREIPLLGCAVFGSLGGTHDEMRAWQQTTVSSFHKVFLHTKAHTHRQTQNCINGHFTNMLVSDGFRQLLQLRLLIVVVVIIVNLYSAFM